MKMAIKRMLALLLSLVAFAWLPVCAAATEDPASEPDVMAGTQEEPPVSGEDPAAARTPAVQARGDTVRDEAELAAWLESHERAGGRVALGGNVTIAGEIAVSGGSARITIDTGQYGLIYRNGAIDLVAGDLEITGEGVDFPVIEIAEAEDLWVNWNLLVQPLRIIATGRNGQGGVALSVLQDSDYYSAVNTLSFKKQGLIRSSGFGAVGLYLDAPVYAYCFNIEAEGENSAAVLACQDVNMYYCKLNARGNGALAVDGPGEVVLDTCAASPVPENARIIKRHIVGVNGYGLYCAVPQNAETFIVKPVYKFLLSGDEEDPVYKRFYIEWDSALDEIDTGIPGRNAVPGRLAPPYDGLGLEEGFPPELIVEVRDPEMPCISGIELFNDFEFGRFTTFEFWKSYDREEENVILWRSVDGGQSWRDITDDHKISWYWNGDSFTYFHGEIEAPILLQIEVAGKGKSNIVNLFLVDSSPGDGDRDFGDRVVSAKPGNSPPTGPDEYSQGETAQNGGIAHGTGGGARRDGAGTRDSGVPESSAADLPEPTPEEEIKPEPAVPQEWEDENAVAISFRRLAAMVEANPNAVAFVKNGIQISVPSGELRALGFDGNRLLTVRIEKMRGHYFSVSFRDDSGEITALSFVAYIGQSVFGDLALESAVCTGEQGEPIPAEYDSASGKLAVYCTGPGVFLLEAGALPEAASTAVTLNDQAVPRAANTTPGSFYAPQDKEQAAQAERIDTSFAPFGVAFALCLCVSVPAGVFSRIRKRSARR